MAQHGHVHPRSAPPGGIAATGTNSRPIMGRRLIPAGDTAAENVGQNSDRQEPAVGPIKPVSQWGAMTVPINDRMTGYAGCSF